MDVVYSALGKLRGEGLTTVIVEQDIARALLTADRFACMRHGQIVLSGPSATADRAESRTPILGCADMLEILINGALIGALYGLYGLGLSLCLGLMRQINLAHGDFIVLSAFLALQLTSHFGIHPLLALPIVVPVMFALGWTLQRFVIERTLGHGEMPPILVTFGLSVILQNVMLELFSADTRASIQGHWGPLQSISARLPSVCFRF